MGRQVALTGVVLLNIKSITILLDTGNKIDCPKTTNVSIGEHVWVIEHNNTYRVEKIEEDLKFHELPIDPTPPPVDYETLDYADITEE